MPNMYVSIICVILLGQCGVGKAQTCSASNTECGPWCRACVGPGNCQECMYVWDTINRTYTLGFEDRSCHECPQNCGWCPYNTTSQTTECQACIGGYTLHEGSCYECPQNCDRCPYNTTSQTTECQYCMDGYTLHEGSCYECPQNCYWCPYNTTSQTTECQACIGRYTAHEGSCYACHEGCYYCYYNDVTPTPGTQCGCHDGTIPDTTTVQDNQYRGICQYYDYYVNYACEEGYYYDDSTPGLPTCTACGIPGCAHCNATLVESITCLEVCRYGYFYDDRLPGLPRCTACPPGCYHCYYNDTTSTPGVECGCPDGEIPDTSVHYTGYCGNTSYPVCMWNRYFYDDRLPGLPRCTACGTNCTACALGSDQMPVCTNCLPGNFIAAGNCQKCGSHCIECELYSGWCLICEKLFNLNSFGECIGNPAITDVSPLFGPLSGGTNVTVSGLNFITNCTVIFLDDIVMNSSSSNRTHVIVTTPKVNSTYQDQPLPVSGQINEMTLSTSYKFIYKGDPKIQKIYPLDTIREGGTTLTVEGDSLDSVSQPVLTITVVIKVIEIKGGVISVISEESQTYKENCKIGNSSTLLCPTPAIDIPDDVKLSENRRRKRAAARVVQSIYLEIKEQSMHQLRDLHLEEPISSNIRNRRQAESDGRQTVADIYIGLIFDGVPDFQNVSDNEELKEYGQLRVNKRPTFEDEQKFTFEKEKPIGIVGTDVDKLRLSDFAVKIGLSDCHVENTTYNTLYCMPPQEKPSTNESQGEGAKEILVFIGSNVKEYIGTITYKSSINTIYIIIGVVVGILILAVVITTSVLLVIRIKAGKTKHKEASQINPNLPIHLPPVPVEESDIISHMPLQDFVLPIGGSSWPPESGMGLEGPNGYSRRRNIPSMYPEDESSNGYLEPKQWARGDDSTFDQDTVAAAASIEGDHFDEFWEQADEADIMDYSRRVADVINNINTISLPDILYN